MTGKIIICPVCNAKNYHKKYSKRVVVRSSVGNIFCYVCDKYTFINPNKRTTKHVQCHRWVMPKSQTTHKECHLFPTYDNLIGNY